MKLITNLILLMISIFALNVQLALAESKVGDEPWRKYPDNSAEKFQDVNTFYDSLDKKCYIEFDHAKLNIREKTYFKDSNKVLSKADEYGKSRTGGVGYHPNRQVYVLATVSNDGKKLLTAVFDAETKKLISSSSSFDRKNPYHSK